MNTSDQLAPDADPVACRECGGCQSDSDARYCNSCGALVKDRRLDPIRIAQGADPFGDSGLAASPTPANNSGATKFPKLRSPATLTVGTAALIAAAGGFLSGGGISVGSTPGSNVLSIPQAQAISTPTTTAVSDESPADDEDTSDASDDSAESTDDAGTSDPVADVEAADTGEAPEAVADDSGASSVDDSGGASSEESPAAPPAIGATAKVTHAWLITVQGPEAEQAVATAGLEGVSLAGFSNTAKGPLSNALSFLAGAAPTAATDGGCVSASTPECAPGATQDSIPAGLVSASKPWRIYFDGVGEPGTPIPAGICGPAPSSDAKASAYAARSPFRFLANLTPEQCGDSVRGLTQIGPDNADSAKAPAFSYISLAGCSVGSAPAAPLSEQVSSTVKSIKASPAYAADGLVVVVATGGNPACDTAPAADAQPLNTVAVMAPGSRIGASVPTAYTPASITKTIGAGLGINAAKSDTAAAFGPELLPAAPSGSAAGSDPGA